MKNYSIKQFFGEIAHLMGGGAIILVGPLTFSMIFV